MADIIKDTVAKYSNFTADEIKKSRQNAEKLSKKALWKEFIKYYEQAFGLKPHTYTFTLKVYKDNKWTIAEDSPTLANPEDPIYKVASYPISSDVPIDDILKNDDITSEEAKKNPDSYNNINVMYNPVNEKGEPVC